MTSPTQQGAQAVHIPSGSSVLEGELDVPDGATGIVLFAHGSGSSRFSPRNQLVALILREAGIGTLLFDLLTPEEESLDARTRALRFNIGLLSGRLEDATQWIKNNSETRPLHIGYFGASTGGAAALVAAARLGKTIGAIVSRGGRPDLAAEALPDVKSPTLLIVGGLDGPVIQFNESALAQLRCEKQLQIVANATHLFEETGALEKVAQLATEWFSRRL